MDGGRRFQIDRPSLSNLGIVVIREQINHENHQVEGAAGSVVFSKTLGRLQVFLVQWFRRRCGPRKQKKAWFVCRLVEHWYGMDTGQLMEGEGGPL